jgi:putative transcriptional regulator
MNITHHPGDATLAAFTSGTFDEGRSLVVAVHLSLCPQCRRAVRAFAHVGGALLDDIEPTAMRADALERAMAQIDRAEMTPASTPALRDPVGTDLPAPLARYAIGSWRWLGRGVQWRPVAVSSAPDSRVFMLKAAPGTRLPHHRHAGTEWTCVLEGAFRHRTGRYGPGDFDEADETVEHEPVVEDDATCICLVALQGKLELQGWVGRLLQPFVRI